MKIARRPYTPGTLSCETNLRSRLLASCMPFQTRLPPLRTEQLVTV